MFTHHTYIAGVGLNVLGRMSFKEALDVLDETGQTEVIPFILFEAKITEFGRFIQ